MERLIECQILITTFHCQFRKNSRLAELRRDASRPHLRRGASYHINSYFRGHCIPTARHSRPSSANPPVPARPSSACRICYGIPQTISARRESAPDILPPDSRATQFLTPARVETIQHQLVVQRSDIHASGRDRWLREQMSAVSCSQRTRPCCVETPEHNPNDAYTESPKTAGGVITLSFLRIARQIRPTSDPGNRAAVFRRRHTHARC